MIRIHPNVSLAPDGNRAVAEIIRSVGGLANRSLYTRDQRRPSPR
jgi:hypothetical protein